MVRTIFAQPDPDQVWAQHRRITDPPPRCRSPRRRGPRGSSSCTPTSGSASAACSSSTSATSVRRDHSAGWRRSRNHPSARQSGGVNRSRTVVVVAPLFAVRVVVVRSISAPPSAPASIRANDARVRIAPRARPSAGARATRGVPPRCWTLARIRDSIDVAGLAAGFGRVTFHPRREIPGQDQVLAGFQQRLA